MKKAITIGVLVLLGIGTFLGLRSYNAIKDSNTGFEGDNKGFYIYPNSSIETLLDTFKNKGILDDYESFEVASEILNFEDEAIKPGYYEVSKGFSNQRIINMIKSGSQKPVKFTFNNLRTFDYFAGQAGKALMIDSLQVLDALKSKLNQPEINEEILMTFLIPDTYEVWWTTSGESLVEKVFNGYESFWTESRRNKAEQLGMTPDQVYTLASIVEKESNDPAERPIIAGLYLNRIKRSIPLQADPTVVFANKIWDARRVLKSHLEIDSPYNTYKNPGLPPGPIYMASKSSIDAVLNATQHDYLYMCAKPDAPGKHAFASTLSEHNRNARKYQQWLNSRGILQ